MPFASRLRARQPIGEGRARRRPPATRGPVKSLHHAPRASAGQRDDLARGAALVPAVGPWTLFRQNSWHVIKWHEVNVGDIVKTLNEEFLPADMILISSSEPQSMCYVATANLDGETNLKIRQASLEVAGIIKEGQLVNLDGKIECEEPDRQFNNFVGTLYLRGKRYHFSLLKYIFSLFWSTVSCSFCSVH
uniref:phospholipid-transporting ATPase IB-like n=1 Tax=Ictidomys tridecemlineatus TaxID=43179 RepID=UPI001A9E9E64|nr:phospholipid-transporting ATPase IB-like [Ictidomys tridecemlineatus]